MKRGDRYTVASTSLVIVGVIRNVSDGFVEGWELHCDGSGRMLSFGPFVRKEEQIVLLREVVEIPVNEVKHAG